jgi:PAS domain S-box-containing protein
MPSDAMAGDSEPVRAMSDERVEPARGDEQFRLLVQGVKDYAIYMLDAEGRVSNWNTGAQRFKGYSEDEIVGEHFSRFYTEEDRLGGLPARALATAATEGRFEQEGWRVRKDGTRFWAHVVIQPIRDEAGTLIGYAKVTRDLTERREAQLALEQARAAFFQAQKMEAIGQLTGGVAHDFNNLIAVVLGNLDLARRRLPEDDKRIRPLLENSIQAAQRGASLTQRMLAFARRQDLKTEPVDLPQLVHDMAELLHRSLTPNIEIDTRFPLDLPRALVDANQLELALLNLTVNARDAMPGGGTITIAARRASVAADEPGGLRRGHYVRLMVQDTGEGMDATTLSRAVEPFFTTKGVGRGTGLGLSMIHGFAEQSGGKLVLASTPGEGTTAEIWLPVAAPESFPSAARKTAAEAGPVVSRLTILVVDDDNLVLMNTAAMLEDLGHEVIQANSGEQALRELARAETVDLVVTDQLMPGLAGTELAARIRALRPELPIILATGYADLPPDTADDIVRLNKPFMQAELARALASLFPRGAERAMAARSGRG